MSNYEDILTRSWDEVPEPKVLPIGSWKLKGRSAKFNPPKGDGNANVMFVYNPTSPMDDVDEAELEKLGADYDLNNNVIFFRIWIEKDTDWQNVKKHLIKHGIEAPSIQDGLKAFKGAEVVAFLSTRTYTNGAGETVEDNDPKQFAPVE